MEALIPLIVSGELAPGEQLVDQALMEWVNASRTPVREAIARLVRMDLVTVEGRRSTCVAQIRPTHVLHVTAVYDVLVGEAARQGIELIEPRDRSRLESFRKVALGSDERFIRAVQSGKLQSEVWDLLLDVYHNEASMRMAWPLGIHVQRVLTQHGDELDVLSSIAQTRVAVDSALEGDGNATAAAIHEFFASPFAQLLRNLPQNVAITDRVI